VFFVEVDSVVAEAVDPVAEHGSQVVSQAQGLAYAHRPTHR
jgi:hypothetical protein